MTREENKDFFANVKLCLNISMGPWLDRNRIFRSEFSNFMKGQYNNIPDYKLDELRVDLIENLRSFLDLYKNIA